MNKPKIGDKIGEIRYGGKGKPDIDTSDFDEACPECKRLKAENARLRTAFRKAIEDGDIVGGNHLVYRIEIIISRKLYDEITTDAKEAEDEN